MEKWDMKLEGTKSPFMTTLTPESKYLESVLAQLFFSVHSALDDT